MEKNEQQLPRLGEPVPAFEAMTTRGKISFPADYKGKWVILFSHPADFTPICTTEILTFGARTEEFRALNCELVGLSIDSRNSHIAWLKTIREKIEYKGMKDVKVGFPIIDDVSMKVASLYGMIQPGESQTAAVRAVFFVDPKGVLRAMIYYPLALGRNFDEIRRVLVGLQTIDAFGIALPADWYPGDEVIVPMKGDDQEKTPEGAKLRLVLLHQAAPERGDRTETRREGLTPSERKTKKGFPAGKLFYRDMYIRFPCDPGRSVKPALRPISGNGIAARRAIPGAVRALRAVFCLLSVIPRGRSIRRRTPRG